jgi:hypothetical protein
MKIAETRAERLARVLLSQPLFAARKAGGVRSNWSLTRVRVGCAERRA